MFVRPAAGPILLPDLTRRPEAGGRRPGPGGRSRTEETRNFGADAASGSGGRRRAGLEGFAEGPIPLAAPARIIAAARAFAEGSGWLPGQIVDRIA